MNIFDDDWNTPVEPGKPRLNACHSCGRDRVLRPGDYCRKCAIVTNPYVEHDKYLIVEPHSISHVVELTGMEGSFLLAKYRNVHEMGCIYVVFYAGGEWQDIVIDQRFHVPTVMWHLIDKMEG